MGTLGSPAARARTGLSRAVSALPDVPRAFLGRGAGWLARQADATPSPTEAPASPDDGMVPDPLEAPDLPVPRPLPLPAGVSEAQLRALYGTWSVDGEPTGHLDAYVADSFGRFVHTYGMTGGLTGRCLELGANPYFTTYLLDEHTDLELTLANFFDSDESSTAQTVRFEGLDGGRVERTYESALFNVENEKFPFDDDRFDVVLFCEIIEHLLMDPVAVLREIRRVLTKDGVVILTTPNVARLRNVFRLIEGGSIYDPYSGYGPYGRHNREYDLAELHSLLGFLGFDVEESFTADSHPDAYRSLRGYDTVAPLLADRASYLGQYLFVRARVARPAREGLPDTLYRSWPEGMIVPLVPLVDPVGAS